MQALIKHGKIVQDDWALLAKLDAEEPIPQGKVLLPLTTWETRRSELDNRAHLGVWLNSDEDPGRIEHDLETFEVIAINFPLFSDGRGYSYAQRLRKNFGYQGELRAVGDVLRDQLLYMKRCGFDAFALRDDLDPQACLSAFNDFSETYQAAADQPLPLFRRR